MANVNVYVDGFNLYYGALKRTPYKWLDLARLCQLMLPKDHIQHIYYYTARVSATFVKRIRQTHLHASQFPATLTDAKGTFHKPASW